MFEWLFGRRRVKPRSPIPSAAAEQELRKPPAAGPDSDFPRCVDRNLKGIELEKKGHTAPAVRLYEANIADQFDGSHPYERLRILYARQHRWADAIRVCEAYIRQ